MNKQSVLEQAKGLSKQEQIDIAMDLWDMVDASAIPLSRELSAGVGPAIAADKLDTSPGQDWDDLRAKLLAGEL